MLEKLVTMLNTLFNLQIRWIEVKEGIINTNTPAILAGNSVIVVDPSKISNWRARFRGAPIDLASMTRHEVIALLILHEVGHLVMESENGAWAFAFVPFIEDDFVVKEVVKVLKEAGV